MKQSDNHQSLRVLSHEILNSASPILSLSSTLSKLPEPDKSEVRITELIQRIKVLYDSQFKQEEIEFDYTVLPEAEVLFADQYQIEQVLINLVKNAFESFPKKAGGKRIYLLASHSSGFVRIEIIDNGSGISPDKTEKIFLPFFTTKESGNGIGLALSKQILNSHNGTISIDSAVDKGTKVILELPKTSFN